MPRKSGQSCDVSQSPSINTHVCLQFSRVPYLLLTVAGKRLFGTKTLGVVYIFYSSAFTSFRPYVGSAKHPTSKKHQFLDLKKLNDEKIGCCKFFSFQKTGRKSNSLIKKLVEKVIKKESGISSLVHKNLVRETKSLNWSTPA